jgi:hypothetical protein
MSSQQKIQGIPTNNETIDYDANNNPLQTSEEILFSGLTMVLLFSYLTFCQWYQNQDGGGYGLSRTFILGL